ncbi:MAG: tetratricopeptide repeat protein [Proteobacteria bacterium]|nr:tetratricopeptide repeat protein [Pseudomonadota bacterium]
MDENLSERQQVEWLRAQLRENAPWALAGVVVFLAVLVGYQQFQGWRERQSATADQKYQATLDALSKGDGDGAGRLVKELRESFGRTPYSDLAALALVRYEVEGGRLASAAQLLEDVIKNTRDPDLVTVARLRLARVQRAEGKPDEALATLAAAGGTGSPAFAEVRGDLLADKGDAAGAVAAWREALASKRAGVNRELVELKIASAGPVAAPAVAPAGAGKAP